MEVRSSDGRPFFHLLQQQQQQHFIVLIEHTVYTITTHIYNKKKKFNNIRGTGSL